MKIADSTSVVNTDRLMGTQESGLSKEKIQNTHGEVKHKLDFYLDKQQKAERAANMAMHESTGHKIARIGARILGILGAIACVAAVGVLAAASGGLSVGVSALALVGSKAVIGTAIAGGVAALAGNIVGFGILKAPKHPEHGQGSATGNIDATMNYDKQMKINEEVQQAVAMKNNLSANQS